MDGRVHGRMEKYITERFRNNFYYKIYTNIVFIVRYQTARHRCLTVKSRVLYKCYLHLIYVVQLEFTTHHQIHTPLSYMCSICPTNCHVVTTRIQLALVPRSTLLSELKLTIVRELALLTAQISALFATDIQTAQCTYL
jgi:hypothetical protein